MKFNYHGHVEGRHAQLAPSQYSWINYDLTKLEERMITVLAASRGSAFHQLANDLIKLKVKLPKNGTTLSLYVNDVIGYRMTPEQILYYSDNCFGTADSLGYRANTLRIFDLKTGVSPASVKQLLIYAALFFLEYGKGLGITPFDVKYDLRIYQSNEAQLYDVDPKEVVAIMDKIVVFSKRIDELRAEEEA